MSIVNQGGAEKNTDALSYGNRHGDIKFGHLHRAKGSSPTSNVTSGVMLQAHDSMHFMTMDNTGHRAGWTIQSTPGSHNITCGQKIPEGTNPTDFCSFFCVAENGDIVLSAPNGKIRLNAQDIILFAEGPGAEGKGNIHLNSSKAIYADTGIFDVKASQGAKIFSPRNMEIVANTSMNISAPFVQGLTSATASLFHHKTVPQAFQIEEGGWVNNNTVFENNNTQRAGGSLPQKPAVSAAETRAVNTLENTTTEGRDISTGNQDFVDQLNAALAPD
jgi:hypothetical protein